MILKEMIILLAKIPTRKQFFPLDFKLNKINLTFLLFENYVEASARRVLDGWKVSYGPLYP